MNRCCVPAPQPNNSGLSMRLNAQTLGRRPRRLEPIWNWRRRLDVVRRQQRVGVVAGQQAARHRLDDAPLVRAAVAGQAMHRRQQFFLHQRARRNGPGHRVESVLACQAQGPARLRVGAGAPRNRSCSAALGWSRLMQRDHSPAALSVCSSAASTPAPELNTIVAAPPEAAAATRAGKSARVQGSPPVKPMMLAPSRCNCPMISVHWRVSRVPWSRFLRLQCQHRYGQASDTARKADTGLSRRPERRFSNIRSNAGPGKGGRNELITHWPLCRVMCSPSSQLRTKASPFKPGTSPPRDFCILAGSRGRPCSLNCRSTRRGTRVTRGLSENPHQAQIGDAHNLRAMAIAKW